MTDKRTPRYATPTGIPLKVPYSQLPENAKKGIDILERAMSDPRAQLSARIHDVWCETLTEAEWQWLRHTEEGRREMWRRMGLARELGAALKMTP